MFLFGTVQTLAFAMRITVVCEEAALSMTIPKKWGALKQVVESYCASPTGKRAGLSPESWAEVALEAGGKRVAASASIAGSLRDGDVLRVVRKESATPLARSACAKHLTRKAEDFASVHDDCEWRGVRFGCYVVCDGHGGQAAAQSAKQTLLTKLLAALDRRDGDPCKVLASQLPAAMTEAFEAVVVDDGSGCTATMVLVLPGSVAAAAAGFEVDSDDEDPIATPELPSKAELDAVAERAVLVVCANVGDSLAYIDDWSAKPPRLLSHDHRLERNASEQQRCRAAGGLVAKEETADSQAATTKKPLRLWPGGLMMSRVLGDNDAPQAIATPEVRACLVADGAARVLVASDGLWDELSGRAAVKLAASKQAPNAAAQELVREARKRGSRRNDTDDIIVVVVDVLVDSQPAESTTLLRAWDVKGSLAGQALDAALVDARRRRVANAARCGSSDGLPWTGLAREPSSFFEPKTVAGVGGFGKVLLCRHRLTGDAVAVKVMTKAALRRKRHERRARVERDALLALAGDNRLVVGLVCAWQTEAAVFLAMPYVGGGDLAAALDAGGRLLPPNAAFYGAQLLCALDFTHARGIMHRDVKPENILLDDHGHAVLIDLGLSRRVPRPELGSDDLARTRCGTDEYWSPEMVRKEKYSTATDVWSALVLVYELLAGKSPFLPDFSKKKQQQQADSAIHDAILTKTLKFAPAEAFSASAVDLLRRGLDRDPRKRLGVGQDRVTADVDAVKRHSWWRLAAAPSGLADTDWWRALEARQIPPPDPPQSLMPKPKTTDALANARDASEAKAILYPSEPSDVHDYGGGGSKTPRDAAFQHVVAAEKIRHRRGNGDPYDGFDHGSPANLCASLPLRSRAVNSEADLAPPAEAIRVEAVVAAHAVARGFAARRVAGRRREAAVLVVRAAHAALKRRRFAKIDATLPYLRRALVAAAAFGRRAAFFAWLRFSARVASARAAQARRKAKEAEDAADRRHQPKRSRPKQSPEDAPATRADADKPPPPRPSSMRQQPKKEQQHSRADDGDPRPPTPHHSQTPPETSQLRLGSRGRGNSRGGRGHGRGRAPAAVVTPLPADPAPATAKGPPKKLDDEDRDKKPPAEAPMKKNGRSRRSQPRNQDDVQRQPPHKPKDDKPSAAPAGESGHSGKPTASRGRSQARDHDSVQPLPPRKSKDGNKAPSGAPAENGRTPKPTASHGRSHPDNVQRQPSHKSKDGTKETSGAPTENGRTPKPTASNGRSQPENGQRVPSHKPKDDNKKTPAASAENGGNHKPTTSRGRSQPDKVQRQPSHKPKDDHKEPSAAPAENGRTRKPTVSRDSNDPSKHNTSDRRQPRLDAQTDGPRKGHPGDAKGESSKKTTKGVDQSLAQAKTVERDDGAPPHASRGRGGRGRGRSGSFRGRGSGRSSPAPPPAAS